MCQRAAQVTAYLAWQQWACRDRETRRRQYVDEPSPAVYDLTAQRRARDNSRRRDMRQVTAECNQPPPEDDPLAHGAIGAPPEGGPVSLPPSPAASDDEGDGDDEALKVDLSKIPDAVQTVAITVTIHDFEARRQSFGQVSNAFIRVVNDKTGKEVVRYDLTEDYSTETAMVFGELYRNNGEWKFRAVGQGYNGGLAAMCTQYGVNIS